MPIASPAIKYKFFFICFNTALISTDVLGQGSTQATTDPADVGEDDLFWTMLNSKVKNLRVVISAHGALYSCCFLIVL